MQHCFQEPDHRSNQEGKRRRPGQHDAVQTHEGKAQPSEKEESMPPAATKKGLARTPGSQAGQPEEDRYHTMSLPGGSSKFNHIDSLRRHQLTHWKPSGISDRQTSEGIPSGVWFITDTLT